MPRVRSGHTARKPARRHRLRVAITDDQRQLLQRAAELQGRSLADFVVAAAHEEAVHTLEPMDVIRLDARESLQLAQTILNPRQPNARLRAAARRYLKNH